MDNDKQSEEIVPESYPVRDFEPKQAGYHDWKQNGNFIHCYSCAIQHGQDIGTKHVLMGVGGNGMPILKKIE